MPGGAASGAKGSSYERELVNRFLDAGWGALRLPSSGSATTTELPDVLAARPVYHHHGGAIQPVMHDVADYLNDGSTAERIRTEAWCIELKSGKDATLYFNHGDPNEIDNLRVFARRLGATPLLGARSTRQATDTATYLVRPDDARGPTDGGLYGLPVSDVAELAFAVVSAEGVTVR